MSPNIFLHSMLTKKLEDYCKTFTKEQCAPEQGKEVALWKGTWPLALQLRPGSEQRATVVITERLIADRTFQQPVVNWMELTGRKLLMHRHDRCSADDLYFGVVQGHSPFKSYKKETIKKYLCSYTFESEGWRQIIAEARPNYPLKWH